MSTTKKRAAFERRRKGIGAKGNYAGRVIRTPGFGRIIEASRKPASGERLSIDVVLADDAADARGTRFGMVTVHGASPDGQTRDRNVAAGAAALRRSREAFLNPGVTLEHGADIPRFRVDAENPAILIREIGGRIDRGRLISGRFVPTG